jgi:hypothetical protein
MPETGESRHEQLQLDLPDLDTEQEPKELTPYEELAAKRQAIIDSAPGAQPERQRTLVRQRLWRQVASAAIARAISPDEVDLLLGPTQVVPQQRESVERQVDEEPELDARTRQLPVGDRD